MLLMKTSLQIGIVNNHGTASGRQIINNPDTVKLIKVLPTTLNDETFFVVVIKLDDDSGLMLERCATRMRQRH